MGRPPLYDDALRQTLLDTAAAQVFQGGLTSLSVRTLAATAGTNTAAIYALFGSKAGLTSALYERAITRFSSRLAAVPTSDNPVEDIVALGLAYRGAAVSDPHGYRIMFGDDVHPLEINRGLALRAANTFTPLLDAVTRAVRAGIFPASPPAGAIATALWANVHGLVTIELGLLLPPEAQNLTPIIEPAIRAAVRGWDVRAS